LIKFRVMGRSAYILAVSEHLKERPLNAGFDVRRIHTIKNGIDFARLDGEKSSFNPLKNLGLKKENTVLMFGWHPFVKGVDVALEAFEIVARQRNDIALVIVGREQTQAEVLEKYPQGNPSWVHLVQPIENVIDYLGNAGVFLSASRREGFPYSVFEAIVCGCMVVASDIPALQWMKGPIHNWWFQNENPNDLAKRIIECTSLKDDERLKVVEVNAAYIRKHLSAEKWADEVIGAYGHVVAHKEQIA
jgi:glycosyltransferase involved in cell wall biosynthesis